jgi:hypothetical protein
MRLSQTQRGQKKEKKGTLTTAIYSDHIARSFYSIFSSSTNQPTHNSLCLEANNIDCGTGTGDDESRREKREEEEEEEEEEKKRTNELAYTRGRKEFFFFFFFSLLHRS